jgi:hypothetical protein
MKYLNYLLKFAICCLVLFIFHGYEAAYAKCPGLTLTDMLNFEHPRVIKYLGEIDNMGKEYRVAGIMLCDGDKFLSNWIFKESIHLPCLGQHIYIFEENYVLRAVIWIERNGKPLKVPPCPKNDCSNIAEPAHLISGDVLTSAEIDPDSGIIVIQYPTKEWVERLRDQASKCTKSR